MVAANLANWLLLRALPLSLPFLRRQSGLLKAKSKPHDIIAQSLVANGPQIKNFPQPGKDSLFNTNHIKKSETHSHYLKEKRLNNNLVDIQAQKVEHKRFKRL